jgi:hypothetical protein
MAPNTEVIVAAVNPSQWTVQQVSDDVATIDQAAGRVFLDNEIKYETI